MGMTHAGGGAPSRPKFFPAGLNVAAKPCGYCKSAAALLFCRAESVFMCIACDSKVHNAADSHKHERVWMCEVCEQAPAVVTCKADAAALCVTCDSDIHAANPLASRHERVPVVPFYDTAESVVIKSAAAAATLLSPAAESDASLFAGVGHDRKFDPDGGYIPDSSWMPTSPIVAAKIPGDAPDLKAMELFFQDSDQFLDFDNYQISSQPYSDSVVPVQTTVKPPFPARFTHDHSPENQFEIDFTRSNFNSYNNNNSSFTTPSLSHSVSSSSMDVGVVPDGSSLSEISYPFGRNIGGSTADPTGNQGSLAIGMDREARVLRYKEKRKNRKFEKTIRYASRKAYAETRPRIKGRFAKRTDSESDIDRIFGVGAANFIADARFGIVPSF
ncbi:zinc finger protein CONSTANS-LIKE 5-like [Salvia miltiorrhiza]|uniref:zinc finger protein CONSTANS-LIKE 5-like n=1 Tax=Salvia miltiorrhiza TaxID=226208 RepID=UPI0025ABC74E|nr:zinc finger protein CONSTANS-LIKE 5-like [Salvia miltiorrhiza]